MDGLEVLKVVITGAARGIGLAAARSFIAAGARVTLVDVDEKELKQASAECGASYAVADVSSSDEAKVAMGKAAEEMDGIDCLVNNAAVFHPSLTLEEMTEEQWEKVLGVNLGGALNCTKEALVHLKESSNASIVNITSTQGLYAQADATAYCAAKGGLQNLTRSLAVDLAKHSIRVNAVAPGFIDTRMAIMEDGGHEHSTDEFKQFYLDKRRIPLARPGKPEDVSGAIMFFTSDKSKYVTGQTLVVDGGLTATY